MLERQGDKPQKDKSAEFKEAVEKFKLFDQNENGAIRFSEFFKALKKLKKDQAEQDYGHLDDKEIRALFRTFDVDGTGSISSCELRKMAVVFDMKPSDQEVKV